MGYFDYPDADVTLEARKRQLEQQRVFLMRQAAEAAQMQSPGGQMVSGIYVPPSKLAYVQKPLAQILNAFQQQALARSQAAYDADEKAAASAVMNRIPAPRQVEQPGPPTEEGAYPAPKTVRPTREENIRWAQEGMDVPSLRQTLEKVIQDQLVQEPIREEARAEKVLDRQAYGRHDQVDLVDGTDGRLYAVNRQTGTAQVIPGVSRQSKDNYQLVTDDSGNVTAFDKRDPNKQIKLGNVGRTTQPPNYQLVTGPTGNVTAVNPKDPTKQVNVGEIGKPSPPGAGGRMSDAARRELDSLSATEQGLAEAISKLRTADDAGTGYVAGLVQEKLPGGPSLVAMRRSREMNDAIQQLTFFTDEIRHGRFGTALTVPEKASAMQYLPGEYDDKAALIRKAVGLQHLIGLNNTRLRAQGAAAAAGGGGSAAPDRTYTPAEAQRLPVGTRFKGTDGNTYVR